MKPIFTGMKKLILFFVLLCPAVYLSAQTEFPSDTLRRSPSANIKEFGGFLLDMGLMSVLPPTLPKQMQEMPSNLTKDYNKLFFLNNDASYTQGFSSAFSPFSSGLTGRYGSFSPSSDYLQMGSFKLKNGMRINTYGNYNSKGWRVPDRNALPWERNKFQGAFELKSANGHFGVRLEVRQGTNMGY
ncbi:hypothetical protein JCM10003_3317 [Bacteroides pyogenes JCM 10003]|nr:hypothetical protein JCM10003_3317 [Bacteroides pyogenes JCM 10003]SUV34845.1 Uncharacterised protein [Bacteroides pyogenes]